jgi:hypothetical protein
MKKALNEISFWLSAMIFAALMVLAASCSSNPPKDAEGNELPSRIHVIEGSSMTLYQIVEVDGHEYISRYEGGITHLESCPCKSK